MKFKYEYYISEDQHLLSVVIFLFPITFKPN